MNLLKWRTDKKLIKNEASENQTSIVTVNTETLKVPQYLYFLITSECNLRCKHCQMWLNKDNSENVLTLPQKLDVIRQFHSLNPNGQVILSGGEIMLREDEFFAISSLCRDLSLSFIGISNASLINQTNYERLLLEGPNLLVISLDSHIETIHDYLRGVKGTYQQTVKVIRELLELRKTMHSKTKVKIITNTVLFDMNISYIHDYIRFASEIGLDGVTFECIHKTYQNKSKTGSDPYFDKNFFSDKNLAIKAIDEVIKDYGKNPFILTNSKTLNWMKQYIENPNLVTSEQICGSHEKNIFIDHEGNYMLCSNMHELSDIPRLGNVKNISLSEFWTSSTTNQARNIMDKCRMHCGVLVCHRRD